MKITVNKKKAGKFSGFSEGDYFTLGTGKVVRRIVNVSHGGETLFGAYRLDTGRVYNVSSTIDKLLGLYGKEDTVNKAILEDSQMTFKEV